MAYNSQGFFALKTAEDLREKARHDLRQMAQAPIDTMLAFNFFVTARHVPEWRYGDEEGAAIVKKSPVLRICRHLGDGAKHFTLKAKYHTQVEGATEHQGAFAVGAFDPGAFDVSRLIVSLATEEAKAAGLPEEVSTVDLGHRIMQALDDLF